MIRYNLSSAAAFVVLGALATTSRPVADAFVPSFCLPPSPASRLASCLAMSSDDNNHDGGGPCEQSAKVSNGVGVLGAFSLAAAVLASGGTPAVAAAVTDLPPSTASATRTVGSLQPSSTLHLSETIKTMEFSLPSSYDSISDAKSAATDELTVTVNPTKAPRAKSGGGGKSKEQQPAMTSEERAALKAAREAQKEADKAAREAAAAADKEAAAAAAEAKRQAAAAVRELEKEQKAAAAKLKREAAAEKQESKKAAAVSSNVEFVNMGLPSYSESAPTEGKRSPFSL